MSAFKYRIRYERIGKDKAMVPCVSDIYGTSAASALNAFHRWMQLAKELDSYKQVVRPQLKHTEYRITGIAQIYASAATGRIGSEMIESAFDLPQNSTNPNLLDKPKEQPENLMGFMDNLPAGRLAQ